MHTRRQALQASLAAASLGSAGLLATPAQAFNAKAFDTHSLQEAARALGATSWAESKEVILTGPDIAENGAVVPLAAVTTLPGIRQLAFMVEKNPATLVAVFHLNESIEPAVATRTKMGQSSDVYAVAIGQDGKAWFARKEIKVTLGGCGG